MSLAMNSRKFRQFDRGQDDQPDRILIPVDLPWQEMILDDEPDDDEEAEGTDGDEDDFDEGFGDEDELDEDGLDEDFDDLEDGGDDSDFEDLERRSTGAMTGLSVFSAYKRACGAGTC